MSLDKAIAHGKEHRRPYRGSKAVSIGCRHGGRCDRCERDRRLAAVKIRGLEATGAWIEEADFTQEMWDRLGTNTNAPAAQGSGA